MGGRSARRRRADVGRLARRRPRCRCSRWCSASPSSRRCWRGAFCARCGGRRNGSGTAGANAVTRAAATPSRKGCWRSATAIPARRARMPMSRAATPRTIRWRCCCTRNRRSSTATAKARSARSAPWPSARIRGCWACAGCSSKRSAPTIPSRAVMIAEEALETGAGLDLGLAGRAGISLRQGRLDRRAGDSRQQSRVGPDRQGGVPASARRAADGARAGAGKRRSRPVARKRDGSDQAGADAGAGRGAGQQISERGASDPALDADRRGGVAGAAASRSRRRLCARQARRFRAAAAGADRDAGREGARPYRERAGDRARRDRRRRNSRAPARRWRRSSPRRRNAWRC